MRKRSTKNQSAQCFAPLGVLLLIAQAAVAQEDPFGTAPKAAREGAAPAAKRAASADPTKREPLAIELLRASNPTSPQDLLQAAQSALQFGRADESKIYLARLVNAKAADDALAALTARHGDFLLELGRTKDVQPEGRQVADLIYAAAVKATQSPERIAAAITALSDSQAGVRQEAVGKLAAAGVQVVNPMLQALADSNREREHSSIRTALAQIGRATELPLIGALETTNQHLKAQVISILGRIGSARAAVHLVRPAVDPNSSLELRQISAAALERTTGAVPDEYEAEKYLAREISRLMRGELPYEFDADDRVRLWLWDEAKQEVSPIALPRRDAGMLLAARAAGDLYALRPGDSPALRLMLLSNLELAKVSAGLDQPLPMEAGTAGALASKAGPAIVAQLLTDAMREGHVAAAIAAAEVLGHSGNTAVLHTAGGGASPLAEAMTYPDRRVRLAAALAAAKLADGSPFPGAGRMVDAFGWYLSTGGHNTVLIGHPRGEDAQSLVGFVNALGYEGEGAYIGRRLAELAFANTDYEFILIADAIDMPPVDELVQWLRRDFRTARQPIGVMARGERFEKLTDTFANDKFTTVFPRIHSVDVAAIEVERLKAIAGRNFVGRDERITQARQALAAMTLLARNPETFAQYGLLQQESRIIQALDTPALAVDSCALLAQYGTPKSQTALIDFASQNSPALADRQAAAAAFAAAVKLRGLRLSQQQVAQQYARFQATPTSDDTGRRLLGSILGAIEAPAIARGELTRHD